MKLGVVEAGATAFGGNREGHAMNDATPKSRRGFASMDPARVKAIASMGGRSVPKEKRAFSTNLDLAAEAGRKGGSHVSGKAAPDKHAVRTSPARKTDAMKATPDGFPS